MGSSSCNGDTFVSYTARTCTRIAVISMLITAGLVLYCHQCNAFPMLSRFKTTNNYHNNNNNNIIKFSRHLPVVTLLGPTKTTTTCSLLRQDQTHSMLSTSKFYHCRCHPDLPQRQQQHQHVFRPPTTRFQSLVLLHLLPSNGDNESEATPSPSSSSKKTTTTITSLSLNTTTGAVVPAAAAASPTTNTTTTSSAQLLPHVLRYRGKVERGFGRGGKQLGVPTANLPSHLFPKQALQNISTGVYFGWAMLEQQHQEQQQQQSPPTAPQQSTYKTVVNIGYSPTFQGQENTEKIIEAHLIVEEIEQHHIQDQVQQHPQQQQQQQEEEENMKDDDEKKKNSLPLPDFYGVYMRLQLIGFLRSEQKFDSFSTLLNQIRQDVYDATLALKDPPFTTCRDMDQDWFFNPSIPWIGGNAIGSGIGRGSATTTSNCDDGGFVVVGGGNEDGSWECQDMSAFLEKLS
jgi:riboflavin kinase